jgi:hypothetical protein
VLLLTGIGEFVAGGAVHVSEAFGKQRINAGYVPFSGEHYMLGEGGGASASGGGNAGGADGKNKGGNHQQKHKEVSVGHLKSAFDSIKNKQHDCNKVSLMLLLLRPVTALVFD